MAEMNGAEYVFTTTLRKPVPGGDGEDVSELKFREPTAADIERCGNPVLLDMASDPPKISFDSKSMSQMMALLATCPPSTIRRLHTRDWNSIAWRLASFFLPDL
jgi:hypothetical protein